MSGVRRNPIAQIKDRGYAKPYLHSGKTVYAMGLAFDPKDRTLKDAKAEKLSSAAD